MKKDLPVNDFSHFMLGLIQGKDEYWKKLDFVLQRAILHWLTYKFKGSAVIEDQVSEEIYQQTLVNLYEKITNAKKLGLVFENYKGLRSYAIGIAKHKAMDYLRQKNRLRSINENTNNQDNQLNINQESANTNFENRNIIRKLFTEIDETEKSILTMFSQGYRMNDIAKSLNLTPENCRVIKYRTLKKLNKRVEDLLKDRNS